MAIRLSGLNSGLDTESIIAELVKVKSTKKEKLIKSQTKMEWKQDAWKELNAKVYGLYSKTLSNMRFEGDYAKKTTSISDSSIADVITGGSAVNGVQTLEVENLATTGYLTGGELTGADGKKADYKSSTKLLDMKDADGNPLFEEGAQINVTVNGVKKTIGVSAEMTIGNFVSKLQEAGVNASFDEKNQRFFISAKDSGADADFKLEFNNDKGEKLLEGLKLVDSGDPNDTDSAKRIKGLDAKILLNGAVFTSKNNTFEINGITITAKAETEAGKPVTLTTQNDTDGIYDMIKGFIKEYNEIINEMDKLYNADSAKDYEPLTDEEKEAMSEDEVEKWEEKIKSSLLRRDSTLGSVSSAMKQIMLSGVEMSDGKKAYLSEFGIGTLSYFVAKDNERNMYHIDGDPDDESTGTNADKLKGAIANDPDRVIEFFKGLASNLYNKLGDLMKSTEHSSAFTLYDDKAMKEEYESYDDKIRDQEEEIAAYEDRYYKKFSAMEVALAKLQSQQSSISGLFGM